VVERVAGQLVAARVDHGADDVVRQPVAGANEQSEPVAGQLEHRGELGAELTSGALRRLGGQLVQRGARERALPELGDGGLLARTDGDLVPVAVRATQQREVLPYSASPSGSPCKRDFSRSTAFVCSCETRDSVTPSTSPISRRVRFS